MNSFKVTAIGRVAQPLELKGSGDSQYTRITLIGNDYAGKDGKGNAREVTTTVYFTAFGSMAKTLAQNVRTGDQLILEARMEANNYTDSNQEKRYGYSFIVDSFQFGAPGKESREALKRNAA